jgi:hypothetical protein
LSPVSQMYGTAQEARRPSRSAQTLQPTTGSERLPCCEVRDSTCLPNGIKATSSFPQLCQATQVLPRYTQTVLRSSEHSALVALCLAQHIVTGVRIAHLWQRSSSRLWVEAQKTGAVHCCAPAGDFYLICERTPFGPPAEHRLGDRLAAALRRGRGHLCPSPGGPRAGRIARGTGRHGGCGTRHHLPERRRPRPSGGTGRCRGRSSAPGRERGGDDEGDSHPAAPQQHAGHLQIDRAPFVQSDHPLWVAGTDGPTSVRETGCLSSWSEARPGGHQVGSSAAGSRKSHDGPG